MYLGAYCLTGWQPTSLQMDPEPYWYVSALLVSFPIFSSCVSVFPYIKAIPNDKLQHKLCELLIVVFEIY